MKPSLSWLYAITLASLLLLPAWLNRPAEKGGHGAASLDVSIILPASQVSDFTFDEDTNGQDAEKSARQQKALASVLFYLVTITGPVKPETRLLGSVVAEIPSCGERVSCSRHLIRGPPFVG